jgi:hypothetical protein
MQPESAARDDADQLAFRAYRQRAQRARILIVAPFSSAGALMGFFGMNSILEAIEEFQRGSPIGYSPIWIMAAAVGIGFVLPLAVASFTGWTLSAAFIRQRRATWVRQISARYGTDAEDLQEVAAALE